MPWLLTHGARALAIMVLDSYHRNSPTSALKRFTFSTWTILPGTVECRYYAVQYSEILHKWLLELRQNINLIGELWGVYYDNFDENWPRYDGTALYTDPYYKDKTVVVSPICPIGIPMLVTCASFQIHKIVGCACTGYARNVSPPSISKETVS